MLSEMWLCGVHSGDIAAMLGKTRNAVMGRIGRTGLMKMQGSGIVPRGLPAGDIRKAVQATFPDVMGRERGNGILDDVCAIILAMAADGRRSRRIPNVAGADLSLVRKVDEALTLSGEWPRRGGANPGWWLQGHTEIQRVSNEIADMIGRMPIAA